MKNEKKNTHISNPHDAFIKQLLRNKTEAVSFIKGVLPDDIKKQVDYESLHLSTNSYINKDLQESFSDIVYTGTYKKEYPVEIAFIIEHKSELQPYHLKMQLTGYFYGYGSRYIKKKERPAIPIMIVLYHGKRKIRDEPLWKFFGRVPPELHHFLPDFDVIISSFNSYDDNDIKTLFDSARLRAAVFVMRDIQKKLAFIDAFYKALKELSDLFGKQEGFDFLISLLYYFENISEEKAAQAEKILTEFKQKGGKTMNIIEEALDKGLKKGRNEGRREGHREGHREGRKEGELYRAAQSALEMIKLGMDNDLISGITYLSKDEILILNKLYVKHAENAIEHIRIKNGKLGV